MKVKVKVILLNFSLSKANSVVFFSPLISFNEVRFMKGWCC